MTLAERLNAVSKIADKNEREQAALGLIDVIDNHPEEFTLTSCLMEASLGRDSLSWGRNMFVPEALQQEGFWLKADGPGFLLCFGDKPA